MRLEEFDFELPEELIAQYPAKERAESRLLVLHREPFKLEHKKFKDIVEYFREGDILVLNKTKVIKARLFGRRVSGGRVELLVTRVLGKNLFEAMVRPGRRAKVGEVIEVKDVKLFIKEWQEGRRIVEIKDDIGVFELLDKYGETPLPPYIKRPPDRTDEERYQTVFAEVPGSIAAPTAGLHFTRKILDELRERGVEILYIILHVGPGTFAPIRVENVEEHRMEEEYYEIPEEVASKIEDAKLRGVQVFSCGTTVTRALESWGMKGELKGWTDLFIFPGFEFKVIDHLITNFHLPKSTPLLLVSAFAGREKILKAYEEAIKMRYRFFSYGDAMLIL